MSDLNKKELWEQINNNLYDICQKNNAPLSEQVKNQMQGMQEGLTDIAQDFIDVPFKVCCDYLDDMRISFTLTIQPVHVLREVSISTPYWWKFYYSLHKYAWNFDSKKSFYSFKTKSRYSSILDDVIKEYVGHIGDGKYYKIDRYK